MKKRVILKFLSCLLFIVLVAVFILFTNMDFPFAIFFLIPLAIYSIQKDIQLLQILTLSLFTTLIWSLTYCIETSTSFNYVILLNAGLRFIIYFSLSYLLFKLTKQRVELTQKNEELLNLNHEKNSILGIAAHDIRNPACAINSFADLLLENLKSKENLKEEIEISTIIFNASRNLLNLVTSLLDLSKIEAGQINLDRNLNDYDAFIESRINLLQIIASKKNINIVYHKTTGLRNIFFDPVYLSEVIDNLITNAIKYSDRDTEIKVIVKISENNLLRTEIVDSGIGINSSELTKLFKPFSRTSNRPTSGEQSTGLGLAIAKKVIDLHGGEIGVESKKDQGSTFYFTLPYHEN
jgi:signal transduction histidine kinase